MDQMELYCPLAVCTANCTANGGTAFAMERGREGKSLDGVYCVSVAKSTNRHREQTRLGVKMKPMVRQSSQGASFLLVPPKTVMHLSSVTRKCF